MKVKFGGNNSFVLVIDFIERVFIAKYQKLGVAKVSRAQAKCEIAVGSATSTGEAEFLESVGDHVDCASFGTHIWSSNLSAVASTTKEVTFKLNSAGCSFLVVASQA